VNGFTFSAPEGGQERDSCGILSDFGFPFKEDIMSQEAKDKIIEWVKQQKKTKHYFNDLCKAIPEIKMMAAKKIINELVNEGKLKYWSSGSTTMYMLPSEGDVAKEEHGMNE
jgi:predicted HTH transcriptional regulator